MATSKSDFIVGLLVGGALGAALALLYAPQSGDESRDALKRKAEDLQDTARRKAEDLQDTAKRKAEDLQGTATETYDKVKAQTDDACRTSQRLH